MPEHTPAPTPHRGIYGFAIYLAAKICLILYLMWATVPEEFFRMIGITCLPQRYWAVTIPIFVLTTFAIYVFIICPSVDLIMVPDVDDMKTITDNAGTKHTKIQEIDGGVDGGCVCKDEELCYHEYYKNDVIMNPRKPIAPHRHLNIWDVSRRLYL